MAIVNTHNIIKNFVSHGFTEAQAEAITDAINDQNNDLATKSDINILKSEIKLVETKIEGDLKSLRTEIKWGMAMLLLVLGMLTKLTFFNN